MLLRELLAEDVSSFAKRIMAKKAEIKKRAHALRSMTDRSQKLKTQTQIFLLKQDITDLAAEMKKAAAAQG